MDPVDVQACYLGGRNCNTLNLQGAQPWTTFLYSNPNESSKHQNRGKCGELNTSFIFEPILVGLDDPPVSSNDQTSLPLQRKYSDPHGTRALGCFLPEWMNRLQRAWWMLEQPPDRPWIGWETAHPWFPGPFPRSFSADSNAEVPTHVFKDDIRSSPIQSPSPAAAFGLLVPHAVGFPPQSLPKELDYEF